jgi:glutamate synthase (NADPH/NADH) small chain
VIGGGDTGSDCIGTSNRQGALSVTQLEIMPQPARQENKALTWPDWPLQAAHLVRHEEGCRARLAGADQARRRRERR